MSESRTEGRVLWGVGTSRTLRAHWALVELGLDYRIERVRTRTGETETEAFTRINPRQKIPVLQDGPITIAESAAIVTHLGESYTHPDSPLVPSVAAERARYFEWLSFVCMELDATSLYVLRRHEYLPQIYGDAPVAIQGAKEYFQRMITSAGQLFGDNQHHLLGERFTGADIVMTTTLEWAVNYGQTLPDNLGAYLDRVSQRPALVKALEVNVP